MAPMAMARSFFGSPGGHGGSAVLAAALFAASGALGAPGASLEDIEKGLKLTENEQTALGAVTDADERWKETAFYMLLGRVSRLGELGAAELAKLDQPACRNLLRDPGRYRLQPIRLRVHVFRVEKLTPDKGLGFSEFWPRAKAVWLMYCTSASAARHQDEPVLVFSTVEPAVLGKPSTVNDAGQQEFEHGPVVEIACILYKVSKQRQEQGGRLRDYPLLLAWQIRGSGDPLRAPVRWTGQVRLTLGAIVLICAGGGAFFLLRRHIRRLAAARKVSKYKPMRDVPDGQGQGPTDNEVDPLLKAAAEQYGMERQQEDDAQRPG